MNGSHVKKIKPIAAIVLAAMVAASWPPGGAWSQGSPPAAAGPVRLAPPQPLKAPEPMRKAPVPAEKAPAAVTLPAAKPPGGGVKTRIQVDTLGMVNPDTIGTLSEDQGGFGYAMWEGTSRALVDTLLPRLPVNTSSPAMRGLMRRLLLSTAQAPDGGDGGVALVALRTRLLAAMGDLAAVNQLLNIIPGRNLNPQLVRIETDTRFLANDNARACALAAGQIAEQDTSYWQKAFIFCQALAGENDQAALGIALLHELGEDDPAFFALLDMLGGGDKAAIESLPDPSPLHLAMARVAKAQLPPDVISSNRPSVLRTIAIAPNASVELRLEAAERSEAAGALRVDALRQLYTGVSFSDDDLANPLSKAEAESGPLSRALLYRTALVQTVPVAQAETVAHALSLAREGGRYPSTVRVFMPILKQIPPSADLIWLAPEAIRAMLIGGEKEAAVAWIELMRASAMFNPESAADLVAMIPLIRLAEASGADTLSSRDLEDWWAGISEDEGAPATATLLFSLFDALGDKVPPALWEALVGGSEQNTVAMPQPALWYRLAAAAKDGPNGAGRRKAETVLLALLALGEGGPGQADPIILNRVLSSLMAVGLTAEARTLAVEAAVVAGL